MTLSRAEVERLNVHATNHTRAHRDEHGMDWDYWTFYPATATESGHFTDGHDYGFYPSVPDEGWVPVKSTVPVPVETLVALLRGLDEAQCLIRSVQVPKKGSDREEAARELYSQLTKLEVLVAQAGGNPHGG